MTALAEIEGCPRRWALGNAEYPQLWNGRGYPPPMHIGALAGIVVHLALETIIRELVRACVSVQDPAAPDVLKGLGGYTKVVHDSIDRVLERVTRNPRALPQFDTAVRSLRAQAPELRTRIQTVLCRLVLSKPAPTVPPYSRDRKARGPLGVGAFPEVELRAPNIGWKGKADLLVLTTAGSEITDFKTGARDERHAFQLHVYALLWSRDEELNPDRRPADRLLLAYVDGAVDVPPLRARDMDDFERSLVARRDAAHAAVNRRPPEARPSAANCQYCFVRQLCDTYWQADTQREIAAEIGNRPFTDIAVTITGRHGQSSWDGMMSRPANASGGGSPAVLRVTRDIAFRPGDQLRVLGASVAADTEDESQPLVITLGALGEVYAIA